MTTLDIVAVKVFRAITHIIARDAHPCLQAHGMSICIACIAERIRARQLRSALTSNLIYAVRF